MPNNRFPLAFGLSLLFHLLALLIPAGRGGVVLFVKNNAFGVTSHHAPLEIVLAPYAMRSPQKMDEAQPQSHSETVTAAAIESQGSDVGAPGHGDAPVGKAEELPPAIPGIEIPRYYRPDELTQRATILRDIDPYLGELENVPGVGKSVLRLWINEQGGVDHVETMSTTLEEAFAKAVAASFMAARFQPAEREGIAVKSQMRVEVDVLPRPRQPFANVTK